MTGLRAWFMRLRGLGVRPSQELGLSEEFQSHLQFQTDENIRRGMAPEDAAREARIASGGMESAKDSYRDRRGLPGIENLVRDVRYAVRTLLKSPGFTIVAVLTLALGIGANSAIFTVVNGVLLQPLPYKDPNRLVFVRSDFQGEIGHAGIAPAEIKDIREQSKSIESIGFMVTPNGSLTDGEEMEHVNAATASDDFLPVLGIKPVLGRGLLAKEDEGSPHIRNLMISYDLWQRRFHGDPDVIGHPIEVNNFQASVIGVLPQGFRLYLGQGSNAPPRIDVWFPAGSDGSSERRYRYFQAVARLRPGATVQQAQAELDALAVRSVQMFPKDYPGGDFRFRLVPLQQDLVQPVRTAILVLFGAVGFVLLIACANIANLMLARASSRQKEIAIRASLGASRWRVIRQLLTESLLLSIAGSVVGLLLANWGVELMLILRPQNLPRQEDIVLNGTVTAFTLALSLLSAIVFGLAPAMHTAKADFNSLLKDSNRSNTTGVGGSRMRSVLVVAQVALSLVLLIGSGLMLRTFANLRGMDLGFDPSHLLTFRLEANGWDFRDATKKWHFYRDAVNAIRTQPGVESVSGTAGLPLDRYQFTDFFAPVSDPDNSQSAIFSPILPNYFRTMRIPLISGRDFDDRDNEDGAAVAIVDDRFSQRLWPGENAIGKRLSVQARSKGELQLAEIVGVAHYVPYDSLRTDPLPVIYIPYRNMTNNVVMTVRVAGDPMSMAAPLRRLTEGLGGKRPVWDIRAMDDYVSDAMAEARFALVLLGLMAVVAFVLSVIGIYGVISYSVSQRLQEFAIRMALGAKPRDILKLALGWGVFPTLAGIAIGLVGSLALTRFLATLVFGVTTTDAATYLAMSLLLFVTALVTCYIPVRLRALRRDLKIT